jgi:hypothetical protein
MSFFLGLLKGTVQRDFQAPIFFIKRLILVPIDKQKAIFSNFFEFLPTFRIKQYGSIDSPY